MKTAAQQGMPPIAPSGWDIKPLLLKKDVGSSWKRNRLLVFPIWRRSPCTDSPAAASSLRVPSLVCVRPRIVVGPSVAARKRKTDDRWGFGSGKTRKQGNAPAVGRCGPTGQGVADLPRGKGLSTVMDRISPAFALLHLVPSRSSLDTGLHLPYHYPSPPTGYGARGHITESRTSHKKAVCWLTWHPGASSAPKAVPGRGCL